MMFIRLMCCMSLLLTAPLAPAPGAAQAAVRLPEGSEIFLRLGRELDPSKLRVEDQFYGDVAVPLTVDDQIVIPAGSQIVGRVVDVGAQAGEFRVGLRCETLILPDNRRFDLSAGLTSKEGEIPEDDDSDPSVAGLGSVDGAVRRGVREGVNALVGLFGRKPEVLEKDTVITVSLTRDLTLSPSRRP